MNTAAAEIIATLDLKPLPLEGGYYRETYRASLRLSIAALGPPYTADKSIATAMYYLLTPDTCSTLHRLPTDEIYHFYAGEPVELLLLNEAGARIETLGADVLAGQQPQFVVPRGTWQGSALRPGGVYALMGTTMAPGFDFADFERAPREELLARYPEHAKRIA